VFLPARQGAVWLEGPGTLFRAKDGLVGTGTTGTAAVTEPAELSLV
jgi:hypothetical protein